MTDTTKTKERYKYVITVTDRPDVGEGIIFLTKAVFDGTGKEITDPLEPITMAGYLVRVMLSAASYFLEKKISSH